MAKFLYNMEFLNDCASKLGLTKKDLSEYFGIPVYNIDKPEVEKGNLFGEYCMDAEALANDTGIEVELVKFAMDKFESRFKVGYAELCDLYINKAMTAREIGKELGFSGSYAHRIIQCYGIDRLRKKLTEKENADAETKEPLKDKLEAMKEELRGMYFERGLSIADIADETGASQSYIHLLFKEWGFKDEENFRGKNQSNINPEVLKEAYEKSGFNISKTAELVDKSEAWIYRKLKEHDLYINKKINVVKAAVTDTLGLGDAGLKSYVGVEREELEAHLNKVGKSEYDTCKMIATKLISGVNIKQLKEDEAIDRETVNRINRYLVDFLAVGACL